MEHIYKEHFLRKTELLNGEWQFVTDPQNVGVSERWFEHFPEGARAVNVPGCWNFELDLFAYFGVAWYLKEFVTEECYLQLEFGAVSGLAEVYLDGEKLGEHYGGWTSFSFGEKVNAGNHRLVVRVDASSNDFNTIPLQKVDWYHYGGIIRSVEKSEYKAPFISDYQISYDLDETLTNASLCVTLGLSDPFGRGVELPVEVLVDGQSVACVTARSDKKSIKIDRIKLEGVRLWGIGRPNLYTITIKTPDDDVVTRIGLRKMEIRGDKFYLNGENVVLKGINRHDEHPDWGFAVPANIAKRDVDIIRDLGCNIVRGSHYPNSQTFVDYLDREGILFWSEIPLWGFTAEAMSEALTLERARTMHREMISQYYHHPSIVIWGLHNEVMTSTEEGYAFTKALFECVKAEDPSRLITYATNKFDSDICLEFCDFVALNYYMGWYGSSISAWEEFISELGERLKAKNVGLKPIVLSEFGCAAIYGYSNFSDDKWTMQYQCDMLEKILGESQKQNAVEGTFVWQFADMRSDNNINRARSFNNKGILDEYRRPKMAYYTVKKYYKK